MIEPLRATLYCKKDKKKIATKWFDNCYKRDECACIKSVSQFQLLSGEFLLGKVVFGRLPPHKEALAAAAAAAAAAALGRP